MHPSRACPPRVPSAKAMEDRVKRNLARHLARVIDLFKQVDSNGDGLVSRVEFSQGLISSGVCTASLRTAIASVFDSWDEDGSGHLDFREFRQKLRRTVPPPGPYDANYSQMMVTRPPPRRTPECVLLAASEAEAADKASARAAAQAADADGDLDGVIEVAVAPPPAHRAPPRRPLAPSVVARPPAAAPPTESGATAPAGPAAALVAHHRPAPSLSGSRGGGSLGQIPTGGGGGFAPSSARGDAGASMEASAAAQLPMSPAAASAMAQGGVQPRAAPRAAPPPPPSVSSAPRRRPPFRNTAAQKNEWKHRAWVPRYDPPNRKLWKDNAHAAGGAAFLAAAPDVETLLARWGVAPAPPPSRPPPMMPPEPKHMRAQAFDAPPPGTMAMS